MSKIGTVLKSILIVLFIINLKFVYSQESKIIDLISSYKDKLYEVHDLVRPSLQKKFKDEVFLKSFDVEGSFIFSEFKVMDWKSRSSGYYDYNIYDFKLLDEKLSGIDVIKLLKTSNIICGDLSEMKYVENDEYVRIEDLKENNISNNESLFEYKQMGDIIYYSLIVNIGIMDGKKVVCEVLLPRKDILYKITTRDKIKCKILLMGIETVSENYSYYYKINSMMLSYRIIKQ